MKLHLCMIVKNESKIITRCFDSIYKFVDSWLIHDTGSTDGTVELIKSYWQEKDVPGQVKSIPWQSFGWNRSQLLKDAKDLDGYLLLADADYIFKIDKDFNKNTLTHDAYYLSWEGDNYYQNIKIVKGGLPWIYVGRTHEYITVEDPNYVTKTESLHTIRIHELYDGGNRASKYERDIQLLTEDLNENPSNSRSLFYLGRTYDDLGKYHEAIEWYKKRVLAGGWFEEQFYAQYKIGLLMIKLGCKFEEFVGELLKAYHLDPLRLESIYAIVHWSRTNGYFHIGESIGLPHLNKQFPVDRKLFLERSVYEWRLKDEVAVCAYYTNNFNLCKKLCLELLSSSLTPESEKPRIENNLKLAKTKINIG